MTLNDIELCFNRSLNYCFSKKKFYLVFSMLILCGILFVFCRALAFVTNNWISMSLVFLPIFLSSGVMLALGTFLVRIYYREIKKMNLSYRNVLSQSWNLMIGTSYLSIPSILIYLFLWIILGFFLLLKELPFIGEFMAVVLAFAPFLIILSSLVLVFLSLAILFYIAPAIALGEKEKFYLTRNVLKKLRQNIFGNLLFFFISIFPIGFISGLLIFAAHLTGLSFAVSKNIISLSIQWFIIMIPFCLFLTPSVIFFFNFAAEGYNLIMKKD